MQFHPYTVPKDPTTFFSPLCFSGTLSDGVAHIELFLAGCASPGGVLPPDQVIPMGSFFDI